MTLELTTRTGRVLDRITVGPRGKLSYQTGAAEPIIAQLEKLTGRSGAAALDVADKWTNGYVSLRAVERPA